MVQFDEMLDALEKMPVEVVSIHATQAKIAEEHFLGWADRQLRLLNVSEQKQSLSIQTKLKK